MNINWNKSPYSSCLHSSEVHIHRIDINSAKHFIPQLEQTLTAEEKSRILKFIFEKDRIIQTLSRAILKDILGRYLSIKPAGVSILNDEYGKPFIDHTLNPDNITFNLSHSGNMILYAVSRNRNVGIDVELIKEIDSIDDLIKQNFSQDETGTLLQLTGRDKTDAFYSCWTRKEAYVKAMGKGLSYPLDKFTVSVFHGEDNSLLHDENNDVSQWTLKEIPSYPGYAAAAAVEGKNVNFKFYEWTF